MSNTLIRTGLPIVCLLTTGFSTDIVIADWTIKTPKGYYNQGYGDFPPSDIEKTLFSHLTTDNSAEKKSLDTISTAPTSSNPPASNPVQNYARQNYAAPDRQNTRQPAYGRYQQHRNYDKVNAYRNNRSTNFNAPWNNNQSNFSGPWNNQGSGFSGPWNNSGSGFSMPWGNNGSGFGPNGNNRSGFNPKGKGGSWGR